MSSPLTKPALFIAGTDTGVGKTLVTCAIAAAMGQGGTRVGVCKPIASGCTLRDGHWVSNDALALQRHCDLPLDVRTIQPIGYEAPVAPAVAAEQTGQPVHKGTIAKALHEIQEHGDITLIEGVGGILVPLGEEMTVRDMAAWLDVPVVVVTRGNLGTLNHTALTCEAIKLSGLRFAGLVINQFGCDDADESVRTNPQWLARQNRTKVLATLPPSGPIEPHLQRVRQSMIDAMALVDWVSICREAR